MYFSTETRRATIRRRAMVDGEPRGDFLDAFTMRASFAARAGSKIVEAGLVEGGATLTARFRDCVNSRSITVGDRVLVNWPGAPLEYAINAILPPRRVDGYVEIVLDDRIGG